MPFGQRLANDGEGEHRGPEVTGHLPFWYLFLSPSPLFFHPPVRDPEIERDCHGGAVRVMADATVLLPAGDGEEGRR